MAENPNENSVLDFDEATERLRDTVTEGIADTLNRLAEGTTIDIQRYASDIARDLVYFTRQGRDNIVDELVEQLEVLGERRRIRANQAAWDVVRGVARTSIQMVENILPLLIQAGAGRLQEEIRG